MAPRVVAVRGATEIAAKLALLGTATDALMQTAVRAAGLVIQNDAKVRAPKLTGNLARSIHTEDVSGRHAVEVGTDVEYAAFVEYGTSRMRAQPYLGPAADGHDEEIEEAIGAVLDTAINAIGGVV